MSKKGAYELIVKNTKSLRIRVTYEDGEEWNGIISTYRTEGYRSERSQTQSKLPRNNLCITWHDGQQRIMPVKEMVNHIFETCIGNPDDVVKAVYEISSAS